MYIHPRGLQYPHDLLALDGVCPDISVCHISCTAHVLKSLIEMLRLLVQAMRFGRVELMIDRSCTTSQHQAVTRYKIV